MNKQQIDCFIALAEYRNFTDAAQRLYISQPALSRQISSLEQEINCRLFNRNNKEVSLTHSGEIMLGHFKEWNTKFETALVEASLYEHLDKQNVKIAIVGGIRFDGFIELIKKIQKYGHSNTVIMKRMVHSEIVVALQRGTYDAAVTFDDPMFDGMNIGALQLSKAGFDFVISKEHYLARKGYITEYDIPNLIIAAEKGVVGTPREIYVNTINDLIKTFGEEAKPKKLLTFSRIEDVIDFLSSCSGGAMINSRTQSEIDPGKYIKIPMVIKRGIVFAWNKKKENHVLSEILDQIHTIVEL